MEGPVRGCIAIRILGSGVRLTCEQEREDSAVEVGYVVILEVVGVRLRERVVVSRSQWSWWILSAHRRQCLIQRS